MSEVLHGSDGPGVAFEDLLAAPPEVLRGGPGHPLTYQRSPSDVVRLIAFVVATVVLAVVVLWADNAVLAVEEDLLRALDFIDSTLGRILEGFATILVGVVSIGGFVLAVALRRYRLLGYILVANVLASGLVALTLHLIDGDRSEIVVNRAADRAGVNIGSTLSATTLAQYVAMFVVLAPFVSRRWRRAGAVLTAVLCLLRLLLAAHLPAELALSLTIGGASGCAVLLAFGRPDQRPSPFAVAEALRRTGLAVVSLSAAPVDTKGSTPYLAELEDGTLVFAKALSPKEQSADLLYRSYRYLRLRSVGDERPFSSLRRAVEHEALVSLQARDVGVRTPRLRSIASIGEDSIALAYDLIDGVSLEDLWDPDGPEDQISDAVLAALWAQVAIMRTHRIAHRDLRRANLFIDAAGDPWVIDFGFSEVAANDQLLDADVAQLLASLSLVAGPERAVSSAVAELGAGAVGAAARLLQPNALSGATKAALHARHGLLDELRQEVVRQTEIDEPDYVRLERFNAKTFLILAMLAGATYFLLPQLADLPGIVRQIEDANWWWFGPLAVASALSYVAAAASIVGAVPQRLAAFPTLVTQVATSFTSRLAPSAVGGMALNVRFLQKSGVDTAVATSGIGLNAVAGVVVHLLLTVLFLVWAGRSAFDSIHLPDPQVVLYGLAGVVVVTVVAFCIPGFRHTIRARLVPILKRSGAGLRDVLRSPAKLALLMGGSAGVTLSYVVAMYVSTLAFGGSLTFAQVGAVYLVGSAVASAAPTPGGLGALEAAVIAGLVAAGMSNTIAVPSVFLFRLATFWIPVLPGWICFTWLQRRRFI